LGALAARFLRDVDLSEDAYCFFNNDLYGCALRDARLFAGLVEGMGWRATRVPSPSETRVG
jgi:hypothetical protein